MRHGRLAQLARAPSSHGGGHWFEPSNAHLDRPNFSQPILFSECEYSLKAPIVDFSEFDPSRKILDREGVEKCNPHRFELSLLDGILFEDFSNIVRAVGIHHVRDDEFWVRGHFPKYPLMPGVVICESAAQLCAYVAHRSQVYVKGIMALGGLDEVRFRGPVKPGDDLIIMLNRAKFRNNIMIISEFQCYVGQGLVAEGIIRGAVLTP